MAGQASPIFLAEASTLALMFAPAIWLVYQVETGEFGPVPLGGMTYWSGVWATSLLLLALAVTPAATMFGWHQLIDVRRMIGVTALAYSIAHLIIYFALRLWNFASIGHEMVTRVSLILATVATAGLLALGATSVDAAVARMGARGWQRLHNWLYVFTALALIHYLLSPDIYPEQYLLSGMFLWLMGWRLLNRSENAADVKALLTLAAASAVFTALLEAAWIRIYHGYALAETLANNLTLDVGLSPAWQILVLGVLIASAVWVRQKFRPAATATKPG